MWFKNAKQIHLTFLKRDLCLSQYEHTVFTLSAQPSVFINGHYGLYTGVKYKTYFWSGYLLLKNLQEPKV